MIKEHDAVICLKRKCFNTASENFNECIQTKIKARYVKYLAPILTV